MHTAPALVRRVATGVAVACVLLSALTTHAAVRATPAKRTDSIIVKSDGRVIEVRSPSGIGSGELKRTGKAWPSAMKVRLKGLAQLEHFMLRAADLSLVCTLERMEGVASQRVCRLGDQSVQPPVQLGPDFEVVVPPKLLATSQTSMVIEWVDSWR
jgi:hypothetical protein